MLKIYIGSAIDPTQVIVSPESTVKQVFADNKINVTNSTVITHNAARLGDNQLNSTLASLGVKDEDMLTVVEKLNSAK